MPGDPGQTDGRPVRPQLARRRSEPALLRALAVALLRAYQIAISPLLPPACRFEPSCSCYAIQAVTDHGVLSGLKLTCLRLLRCHPFAKGGLDPVPPVRIPEFEAGRSLEPMK